MREFLQVMKEILTPIVLMALLYTLAYIVVRISRIAAAGLEKLRGEAEASGKSAQEAAFRLAITVLEGVANTVISVMESEKAYALRQKVKAGQAAPEELKALGQEAYEQIVQMLDVQVKADLDSCLADTEAYVRDKIEELLPGVKAAYRETVLEEITGET